MHLSRLAAVLAGVAAAPVALLVVGLDPSLLFEPRQLLLVVGLPYLFAALSHGPAAAPRAVALAIAADSRDRSGDERDAAGALLRELGGLAVAVGAAAFTLELLRVLTAVAASTDTAGANELVVGLGASLVGPLWGVALKLLVYDPLATAVEPAPGELADTLG
ncbi:MAG: hypothetical protein GC161_12000 [Planctomycetaceae bacterium]|nr:hypothetical protein [Planctomycetaceae bacterium]